MNWYREKDPRTSLGAAYIYSYAQQVLEFETGNEIGFVEYDVRDNLSLAVHEIITKNPKILGIGVYCWNVESTTKTMRSLRKLGYRGIIVLGGPEITFGGEELPSEFPEADYFIKGDGEFAFCEVIQAIANGRKTHGKGIFHRSSKEFKGYAILSNIDYVLPPHLNPDLQEKIIGNGFTRWQTQRGCVYRCSFCAFPNGYAKLHESDLTHISTQLEIFVEHSVEEVAVLDPIFFVRKERAMAILELIDRICPWIKFEIQTKLEHLDDEVIENVKQLNIVLECGVETLDPKVQEIIRRKNNQEKVIEIMKKLQSKGITYEVHLIYGLPKQTMGSFLADFELVSQYTSLLKLFPLSLLKGTRMDKDYHEKYEQDIRFSPIFPHEIIETKWMDPEEILRIKRGKYVNLKN